MDHVEAEGKLFDIVPYFAEQIAIYRNVDKAEVVIGKLKGKRKQTIEGVIGLQGGFITDSKWLTCPPDVAVKFFVPLLVQAGRMTIKL